MPEDRAPSGSERLAAARGARRSRRFGPLQFLAALMVSMAAALAAGFGLFIAQLPTEEVALREFADGIVVFTGGSSRVSDAMELLAQGRGRRLLISGVYPRNRAGEISRTLPEHNTLLECCVDLDHYATNTRGNAVETRRWVRELGFRSLVVVTSNYHMPRALAELSRAMPDVRLIPFPVIGDRWRTDVDWAGGVRARLLLSEYAKLVVAETRGWMSDLGILPDLAATTSAAARSRPATASVK